LGICVKTYHSQSPLGEIEGRGGQTLVNHPKIPVIGKNIFLFSRNFQVDHHTYLAEALYGHGHIMSADQTPLVSFYRVFLDLTVILFHKITNKDHFVFTRVHTYFQPNRHNLAAWSYHLSFAPHWTFARIEIDLTSLTTHQSISIHKDPSPDIVPGSSDLIAGA